MLITENKLDKELKYSNNIYNQNITKNLLTTEKLVNEINFYNKNILSDDYKKSLYNFFLSSQIKE